MGYFMYVCPECRKVFKVQGNDKKVKCSNCANILKDMRVAVEEWEVMDKAQREDLKSRMCMPEEEPVIQMEEEPVPEEVRPAKPVEPEGKICPKCGCMNPVSSKFCNECGFDMNAPSHRRINQRVYSLLFQAVSLMTLMIRLQVHQIHLCPLHRRRRRFLTFPTITIT